MIGLRQSLLICCIIGACIVWRIAAAADNQFNCYVCTSYIPQCQEVMSDGQGQVSMTGCSSKCYLRVGEEEETEALYRGCFDGFMEVGDLDHDYNGCKNQTWNGKTRIWCLCTGELCNQHSIATLSTNHQQDGPGAKEIRDPGTSSQHVSGYGEAGPYQYPGVLDFEPPYEYEEIKGYSSEKAANSLHAGQHDPPASYQPPQDPQRLYDGTQTYNGLQTYDARGMMTQNDPRSSYPDLQAQPPPPPPPPPARDDPGLHQADAPGGYGRPEGKATGPLKPIDEYEVQSESIGYKPLSIPPSRPVASRSQPHSPVGGGGTPYDVQFQLYPDEEADQKLREQVYFGHASEMFDTLPDDLYPPASPPKMGGSNYIDDKMQEGNKLQQYSGGYPLEQAIEDPHGFYQEPYYPYPSYVMDPYHYVYDSSTTTTTRKPPVTSPPTTTVHSGGAGGEKNEEDYDYEALAAKIFCTKTGYYQDPDDCNAFVACIMDPHYGQPVMYPMRCPQGLDWDNNMHICRVSSPTCNSSGQPAPASPSVREEKPHSFRKLVDSHKQPQRQQQNPEHEHFGADSDGVYIRE